MEILPATESIFYVKELLPKDLSVRLDAPRYEGTQFVPDGSSDRVAPFPRQFRLLPGAVGIAGACTV